MSRLLLATAAAALLLASLLAPGTASAKSWNGLEPGVATKVDVLSKFGDPTRKTQAKGKDILVYSGTQAMKSTVQVQFKLDQSGTVVERIDVYPEPVITRDAIEKSYGGECKAKVVDEPCYHRKESEAKHAYFLYVKLGLAIFFKDDGKTVQSFAFLPAK